MSPTVMSKSPSSPARRLAVWLPLAAFVVALFAGEPPAARAGTVSFKYMYINDDEEGGVGDWKVTADVSPGQQGVPLLDNVEGGTGESLTINKDVLFQSFPFTVTLKVEEHDGGIGATWEHVGTQTLTIHQTGNFHMRVKNNEGDVSIYFDVFNTGSTQQPLTPGSKPKAKVGATKPGAIQFVKPHITQVQSSEGTVQSLPAVVAGKKFWLIGGSFGNDKSKVAVQFLKHGQPVKTLPADGVLGYASPTGNDPAQSGVLVTAPSLPVGPYQVRVMVWGKGVSGRKSVFMKTPFAEADSLPTPGLHKRPGTQVMPTPSNAPAGISKPQRPSESRPGTRKLVPLPSGKRLR